MVESGSAGRELPAAAPLSGETILLILRRFKMKRWIPLAAAFLALVPAAGLFAAGSGERPVISSAEYQERPTLEMSLFQSDQAVLDESAIKRILTSKFALPDGIKVTVLKLKRDEGQALRYYGTYYWRSEEYLKTQQGFIDILSEGIGASERVLEVAVLPEILSPKIPTIPTIRETAVRMQSDILLVYYLSSNIYQKYRVFKRNEAKAFSTCEAFFLDIRTGLIPFSTTITEEFYTKKQDSDASFQETTLRAENGAVLSALEALGREAAEFLSYVPGQDEAEEAEPAAGPAGEDQPAGAAGPAGEGEAAAAGGPGPFRRAPWSAILRPWMSSPC
jgi:hypothetical protein